MSGPRFEPHVQQFWAALGLVWTPSTAASTATDTSDGAISPFPTNRVRLTTSPFVFNANGCDLGLVFAIPIISHFAFDGRWRCCHLTVGEWQALPTTTASTILLLLIFFVVWLKAVCWALVQNRGVEVISVFIVWTSPFIGVQVIGYTAAMISHLWSSATYIFFFLHTRTLWLHSCIDYTILHLTNSSTVIAFRWYWLLRMHSSYTQALSLSLPLSLTYTHTHTHTYLHHCTCSSFFLDIHRPAHLAMCPSEFADALQKSLHVSQIMFPVVTTWSLLAEIMCTQYAFIHHQHTHVRTNTHTPSSSCLNAHYTRPVT